IHDVKVRISGDTATVTYGGTYTASGFKDPNANVPGAHFVVVDTWQKTAGKWKLISSAAVSTEPIPAEAYKMPAQGAANRSEERRVGKECRCGGGRDHEKKKKRRSITHRR